MHPESLIFTLLLSNIAVIGLSVLLIIFAFTAYSLKCVLLLFASCFSAIYFYISTINCPFMTCILIFLMKRYILQCNTLPKIKALLIITLTVKHTWH